jgi:hypothetical protein
MLSDEVAEPQPFVEFPHEEQPTIGGDSRALEVDPEPGVERELQRLVLGFTHRVGTSAAS